MRWISMFNRRRTRIVWIPRIEPVAPVSGTMIFGREGGFEGLYPVCAVVDGSALHWLVKKSIVRELAPDGWAISSRGPRCSRRPVPRTKKRREKKTCRKQTMHI
jgi:hypothetical protein